MLGQQSGLTVQFAGWRQGNLDYRRANALAARLDPAGAAPLAKGWRLIPKKLPVDVIATPTLIRLNADHAVFQGKTALYGATTVHQGKVMLPAVRLILSRA